MATMTITEAQTFRAAHDAEVRKLSRKSRAELASIDAAELAARGMQRLYGGPHSKDELINEIIGFHYPLERLNETTHILYHKPGESWSACEWCHPHGGEHCDCALGRTAR
jgi:hypothetical protein